MKAKVSTKKAKVKHLDFKDTIKDLDFKEMGKNALKIAIPLVVLKLIHSQYKKATKKSNFEEAIESLYKEVKSKIKKLS